MNRRVPAGLKNIGPVSSRWLAAVGVHKRADLIRLGAVKAFLRVKAAGYRPSLNLLYALAGAERGLHWRRLPEDARQRLLIELDAAAALPNDEPDTSEPADRRGPSRRRSA